MTRCTGHCCDPVYLDHAALDLATDPKRNPWPEDLAWALQLRFRRWEQPIAGSDVRATFDCPHYERATGNCGVYDDRPPVCRDYPHGRPCTTPGCTRVAT